MFIDAHNRFNTLHLSLSPILIVCMLFVCLCMPVRAEETTNIYGSDYTDKPGIVSEHGQLRVSAEGIVVDQYEASFQLQGISTHNLAWYPEYVNIETLRRLRDDFSVNTIRLAMYTADNGGYCVSSDEGRTELLKCVLSGIDAAIELDMYVIVDWHILSDNNPNTYKQEALAFFETVASVYGNSPNLIYEICNEPNGPTSWEDIRLYAVDVIDCIRTYAPDSLIIVGTPSWSQDIDLAAQYPIERSNLLYSLHFYAATHKDELRGKLESAVSSGLPVIVSEFGITEASGSGLIDTESADTWISMLDYYGIGYIYWNLSNKDEACALLVSSCSDPVNWTESDLSAAGQWFYSLQRQETRTHSGYTPGLYSAFSSAPTTVYASNDYWSFSNGCSVSVSCTDTWSDDSWQYASYDVTVSNNAVSALSNWRFRITWNDEIFPKEYWSCEIGGSGNNRLFIPVDYNTTIPSGASVTFGMIVYGSQLPVLSNVSYE